MKDQHRDLWAKVINNISNIDNYRDYDEEDCYFEDDEPDEDDPHDIESMAIRMMDVMVENNINSFILLKDPIVARWWEDILADRKRKAEHQKIREEAKQKAQEERARAELLARLTPEEKRLLGIM